MTWFDLVNLGGGLALFLYGMVLAREGLQQGAGNRLRRILGSLTRNRLSGLGLGALVTFLLQSSSATTVVLVGLAASGILTFARTVAVILGSDIGTTLTVQLISIKVSHFALLFVLLGFLGTQLVKKGTRRFYAQALMGFGFIFFGMQVMSDATRPLRDLPWFMSFIASLGDNPVLGILLSTLFTAVIQSSAATIGIALSFAAAGALQLEAAVAIILGANVGTCATALLAAAGADVEGRRVAAAHTLIKIAGVLLLAPFIAPFARLVENASGANLTRQVANAHTFFNVGLAVVFLPFTGLIARAIERLVQVRRKEGEFAALYLDEGALHMPPLALANAGREVQRMANLVEEMLAHAIQPFQDDDLDLVEKITAEDEKVDRLNKQTKLYLSRMSQHALTPPQAREEYELVDFASSLESVADIICKNLMYHAQKRIRRGYRFSDEGLREIQGLHHRTLEHFRLAVAVSLARDPNLAARCIEEKRELRELTGELKRHHLERLHRGISAAIETTSLHMDVVDSFARINSAITTMAYRTLRAAESN